jgi:hypothetical protein
LAIALSNISFGTNQPEGQWPSLICRKFGGIGNVGNIPCNVGFADIKIGDIRYGIRGQCGCDR